MSNEISISVSEAISIGMVEKGEVITNTSASSFADGNKGPPSPERRQWRTGKASRFPWISAIALFMVLCMCIVILLVILLSDQKDQDEWGAFTKTVGIGKFKKKAHAVVTVNIWISIFLFLSTKALAVAYVEVLSIAWWVGALKGKTLDALNHEYEAGRGVGAIVKNFKFFNWLCVCSITYTLWGAMGPLLQRASTLEINTTVWSNMNASTYAHNRVPLENRPYALQANLSTTFAPLMSALTDNTTFQVFHDLAPPTSKLATMYTDNLDLVMAVNGCPSIGRNRPSSQCFGWFQTIGWKWDCGEDDDVVHAVPNSNKSTYFRVAFHYDAKGDGPHRISVDIHFKKDPSCTGSIIQRRCYLTPAIVLVPVEFTMINPDMSTEAEKLVESWYTKIAQSFVGYNASMLALETDYFPKSKSDYDGYNFPTATTAKFDTFEKNGTGFGFEDVLKGRGDGYVWADQVIKPAPIVSLSSINSSGVAELTLDGLVKLFDSLFTSSLVASGKDTISQEATVESTGGLLLPFSFRNHLDASSSYDLPVCHISFTDPTQQVIELVREITFRYSALYGMFYLRDYYKNYLGGQHYYGLLNSVSDVDYHADQYRATLNRYHTHHAWLAVSAFFMLAGLFCTASLFWGYWKLGRRVSLSPLEMAKAMNVPGQNWMQAGQNSNANADELMGVLGAKEVKYGEVAPNVLGFGLVKEGHPRVFKPRDMHKYD